MGEHQSEQAKFRQERYEEVNRQKIEEEKRIIDYINSSFEQIKGLRSPEAWKSFLFLKKELKKVFRIWEAKIKDIKTPEKERDYYIGALYGASFIFEVSHTSIALKKDLDKGNKANVLKFFQRGGK